MNTTQEYYRIDKNKNAVIIYLYFWDPIDKYYPIIKKYPVLLFEREISLEDGWRPSRIYNQSPGFNHHIVLTKNLKKVSFGSYFNTHFNISKYLTCLLFGALFDQSITLTKQLKILHLGQEFNKPIFLSKHLVHLTLSIRYNHPLVITKHLTQLRLGKYFNQTIILPKYLVHLSIGMFFDKKIYFEYPLGSFSIGYVQPRTHTYHSPIIDDLPNMKIGGKFILEETFDAPFDNIPNYVSIQNNNKIRNKLPERYKEKCFKLHVWGQK